MSQNGRAGVDVVLEGVSRTYDGSDRARPALDAVSLTVSAGDLVAISGPSGSGKSTLLHVVGGMDSPDAGSVRVGAASLAGLSSKQQAAYRRSIGFVFQRFHLLPALTVLDNVVAPLLPVRTAFDKHARGRELLAAVGLKDMERRLPSRLSGGEQQRVAIARALVNSPGLLLADEPTGNLDSATGERVLELLLGLRAQYGMTILVATHDADVEAHCDRTVRLHDGRVVGPP